MKSFSRDLIDVASFAENTHHIHLNIAENDTLHGSFNRIVPSESGDNGQAVMLRNTGLNIRIHPICR